ncbi:WalW protein [Novosphingobium sp. PC22D]|uniref:polysaccharide deacetylase family protein n=1 Tax=Novosphingobium sp. PC22D TaxID=1962403 RepID=UPI000BF0F893|nr:polysaccharide deacetylase family protein [Novosphingobium sp. PC22D]PEQ10461.1 WalW protein [Novosphingobium sp. PC22D]
MSGSNLLDRPGDSDFARFCEDFGQRFVVTVDVEEEFDWDKPIQREAFGLASVPALAKFQQFCEGFGVVPVYMIDYPIATSSIAADILGTAARDGRAEIGIQLHPWVNPPFEEEVNEFNSYAGNLPVDLERAKLMRLRDAIVANLGVAPKIYRAGRYGLGPRTAALLGEAGVAIDSSVRARFDYSNGGGPNYRKHPLHPYWIGDGRSLLELPLTTVYWGPLRELGETIYPHLWRAPSLRGVLARTGLLERIPLTPEGITADEAIRGTDIALDERLPVLVYSFHSPSLAPGHTPYVRTDGDLDRFYDWWRAVFAHLEGRGVRPACVGDIVGSVVLA